MKVAILGAESTGKTELARALVAHFEANAASARLVPEFLREWCISQARTPRSEEQAGIAQEQARRVQQSHADELVIADTTPLMIAIYSDLLFGDRSLYDMALDHQRSFDLTLVTGLDLPWVADGLQRDGPHVREPVDALLRAALIQGKIPFQVVYGVDALRTDNALKCITAFKNMHQASTDMPASETTAAAEKAGSIWVCERCSDPDCEHRLFTSLLPRS
ncbi:MAG: ATP-binding protein [Burkholderiaceae bacterium]|nr:ATP-binding protein [Burkholderiaceae bacterium]